jgi:hypothetical protein
VISCINIDEKILNNFNKLSSIIHRKDNTVGLNKVYPRNASLVLYWKINIFYHINRLKKEKTMIILINTMMLSERSQTKSISDLFI